MRDSDPTIPFEATQACTSYQAAAVTPESSACINNGMDATLHYSPIPCKSLPQRRDIYHSQLLDAQQVGSEEGKDSAMVVEEPKDHNNEPVGSGEQPKDAKIEDPTLGLLEEEAHRIPKFEWFNIIDFTHPNSASRPTNSCR